MFMLELLLAACVLITFIAALRIFDHHCSNKFGHRFFTKGPFAATALSCALIAGGYHWYLAAVKVHGDTLNGLVVAGVGVVGLAGMAIVNIANTNLLWGLGGTAIQLPLFVGLTYAGWPLFLVGAVIYTLAGGASSPVRVVNLPAFYEPHRFHRR